VYQSVMQEFRFRSAIGADFNADRQYIIDSKSMRKVGPDDDIAIIWQEINGVGAFGSVLGRMLVKLH